MKGAAGGLRGCRLRAQIIKTQTSESSRVCARTNPSDFQNKNPKTKTEKTEKNTKNNQKNKKPHKAQERENQEGPGKTKENKQKPSQRSKQETQKQRNTGPGFARAPVALCRLHTTSFRCLTGCYQDTVNPPTTF